MDFGFYHTDVIVRIDGTTLPEERVDMFQEIVDDPRWMPGLTNIILNLMDPYAFAADNPILANKLLGILRKASVRRIAVYTINDIVLESAKMLGRLARDMQMPYGVFAPYATAV